MHELRIGQAFGAHRRVDALNPKRAEVALFDLAIAVCVLAGLFDRLARDADGVLAATAIALGLVYPESGLDGLKPKLRLP